MFPLSICFLSFETGKKKMPTFGYYRDLSYNNLTEISAGVFTNLPNLMEL